MPNPLSKAKKVEYVAGRSFTHLGKPYEKGDDVPDAHTFPKLEVMVRSRHLIATTRDPNALPRGLRNDVWRRDLAFQKMGLKDPRDAIKGKRVGRSHQNDEPADHGVFTPWEETTDNAAALHEQTMENIALEEDEMAKHKVKLVDGKEESEPVEMLGTDARDAEVEYVEVEEPDLKRDPKIEKVLDGKLDASKLDVADNYDDSLLHPENHSVAEINEYLNGQITADERERVLNAEKNGKNRKGVVGNE